MSNIINLQNRIREASQALVNARKHLTDLNRLPTSDENDRNIEATEELIFDLEDEIFEAEEEMDEIYSTSNEYYDD